MAHEALYYCSTLPSAVNLGSVHSTAPRIQMQPPPLPPWVQHESLAACAPLTHRKNPSIPYLQLLQRDGLRARGVLEQNLANAVCAAAALVGGPRKMQVGAHL